MKKLLLLAALLLWSTIPGPAAATHVERGCREAPLYMQVPHWVQDELCKPAGIEDGHFYAVGIVMRGRDGNAVEMLAIYPTQEAADERDTEKLIGVLIFEIDPDTGRRQRVIEYRSEITDREYHAPARVNPGMEV